MVLFAASLFDSNAYYNITWQWCINALYNSFKKNSNKSYERLFGNDKDEMNPMLASATTISEPKEPDFLHTG